jgi:cell wall-associated NlpC family hydrolase
LNLRLVAAAWDAMHDPEIEATRGYCSRFVRQVVEKVYGSRYDFLFRDTAIHTGEAFRAARLANTPGRMGDLQPGDILFKMTGSGVFGHVGIYTGIGVETHTGKVAENSSTTIGRISGAKGYRTLAQFGKYQLVGRLPE